MIVHILPGKDNVFADINASFQANYMILNIRFTYNNTEYKSQLHICIKAMV